MQRGCERCCLNRVSWLLSSSSSRQTEGGEGLRELAQRETGALIRNRLTGCVERAAVQEEHKRRNGGTSWLKTTEKREREGGRINRAITEEREVIQSGEKEKAGWSSGGYGRRRRALQQAFTDGRRSKRERTQSGKEEEKERKPGRGQQNLSSTKARRGGAWCKAMGLIWSEYF